MNRATAQFFDARTLATKPVEFEADDEVFRVHFSDGTAHTVPLAQVKFSHRLGDVPRFITLPDESSLETADNAAVDALLARRRRGRFAALIHVLEQHSTFAAVATVLLVCTVSAGLFFGLPIAAREAAQAVPVSIENHAGRQAYETFQNFLGPSRLTSFERARVSRQAEALASRLGLPGKPQVRFHTFGPHPNAFALPGGTIVMTDALVKLATPEELDAVLAHEFAHWQRRHTLQSIFRGSAALLLVTAVTGDLSTLTAFAATIPITLLQRGYSREFETEADADAIESLRRAGIDPRHMASILHKLEAAREAGPQDYSYLSTHPATEERKRRADPDGTFRELADPDGPFTFSAVAQSPVPTTALAIAAAPEARRDKTTVVEVEFVISPDGKVGEARVVSAPVPDLDEHTLSSVRKWRFEPGERAGKRVATLTHARVAFRTEGRPIVRTEITDYARAKPKVAKSKANVTPDTPFDVPPVLKHPAAVPDYPLELRAAGVEGEVLVEYIVDIRGVVVQARAVKSTHEAFAEPAVNAVRAWTFEPARKAGVPVITRVQQTVTFNLDDEPTPDQR